jgi:GNAT superfamily N-acetyltransferase
MPIPKGHSDDPWAAPFDKLIVRRSLSELLHSPAYGLIFMARDGQVPIAYLAICFDFSLEYRGKGAWIDELLVEPPYRGKGICSLTWPRALLANTVVKPYISK